MSCYCNECSAIRNARTVVDNIDIAKLCMSKEPEDLQIAIEVVTATKHLKQAQEALEKKHVGGADHQGMQNGASALGARDNSITSRQLSPSNLPNVGKAYGRRDDANSPPSGAYDSALVLHRRASSAESSGGSGSGSGVRTNENTSPSNSGDSRLVLSKNTFTSPSRQEIHNRIQQFRQLSISSNPWSGKDAPSPKTSRAFQNALRTKAEELGILGRAETMDNNGSLVHGPNPPTVTNIQDTKDPIKEKSRFIVCDHCRSHGLRCNEASVCKECIIRELPCTHRACDQSVGDRNACPRQVCFYVHADWMPDIHGNHNPHDLNWIVLPGKLRDHLSAGQLARMKPQSEAEIMRCYEGVPRRQQKAIRDVREYVESGQGPLESLNMACGCVEIEYELARAAQGEENIRRMQQIALANGIGEI